MAEGCRGTAGMAAEGLDLEMHHGLPSARIAFDLNLNVDLSLFARRREGMFGFDGWSWLRRINPIKTSVRLGSTVRKGKRKTQVYEGPAAAGGDDMPVPPAVTDGVAVTGVKMGSVVVCKGPVAGDGTVTQVGVLATLEDEPVEAGQVVPAGSADCTQLPPGDEVQLLPWAGIGACQSRRMADMVRACVRDQLQNKHRLPRDLPLCYIGGRVPCQSDMNAWRARFLLPARTRAGLRTFLYPANITAWGFNTTDPKPIRIPGVRARPTTYLDMSWSTPSAVANAPGSWPSDGLKLNKFHRCNSTVINGKGYMSFIVDCRLETGDGVEVWAFQWPPGIRSCLLIAKKDVVRPNQTCRVCSLPS
ncbi:hypothetical protein VPH35_085899 [Triticum aestivum]